MEGWRTVVDAVKAVPGHGAIFLQLWHMGRASHSSFQPGGAAPVSASATAVPPPSLITDASGSRVPYETARALEEAELPGVVAQVHAPVCMQMQ